MSTPHEHSVLAALDLPGQLTQARREGRVEAATEAYWALRRHVDAYLKAKPVVDARQKWQASEGTDNRAFNPYLSHRAFADGYRCAAAHVAGLSGLTVDDLEDERATADDVGGLAPDPGRARRAAVSRLDAEALYTAIDRQPQPPAEGLDRSDDAVPYINGDGGYLWLTCGLCDQPIAQVEAGDTLDSFVTASAGHRCTTVSGA